MALLRVCVTLAVCLLLGDQTFANNNAPCQPSKWNNGYNTFVTRHIRNDTPTSTNQNEWEKYIKNNGGCDRPTQSFLHPQDLEGVKNVCRRGGKVYRENLCISKQPFTFVTVRSELVTCRIKSVLKETKHLILACDLLNNQCLPVHFEGNPTNSTPNNNARDCQAPDLEAPRGHAPSFKTTWLWLFSALLFIIYGY